MPKNINFILLILFSLIKNILLEEILLFTFQIFKHGASAPISGVKDGKDLFNENWLENGEISNIGKRQHYLLGVKARNRYIKQNKLLKEIYDPNEILIKSTDSNRTIESIYSFVQGLYPFGTGPTIKERNIDRKDIIYPPNLKYYKEFDEILKNYAIDNNTSALPYQMNLFPIHIFYIPDVEIQLYDPKICKGLENEYKTLNKKKNISDFSKKIMSNNENLFKELEKRYTGKKNIDNNFMENYDTLSRYTDNFVCDIKDKREFSKFNEEFPEHTLNLTNLYNYSKSFIIKDYEINNNMTNRSLVEASLTLRNITYWMNIAKYNHNNTNRKYFKYVVYSVDENTIGAFEGLMCRLFDLPIEYIDYADTRALELYNDTKNNDLYVKYMKGNNWYKKKMKYSYFRSIVYNNSKTMNYYNVTKFCEFGETKGKNYDINLGGASLMIILSVLDGVLIVLLILFCAKKSR